MATYQPVPQKADSDSEEGEEMTIFAKDFGEDEREEKEELIRTVLPGRKNQGSDESAYTRRVRGVIAIFALIAAIIIAVILVYSVYSLVQSSQPLTESNHTSTCTGEPAATPTNLPSAAPHLSSWKVVEYGMTEMSPALLDIDEDGMLDVIVTLVTLGAKPESTPCFGNGSEKCISMGVDYCRVHLQVLSGKDGQKLAEIWTDMATFAIRCPEDLTGDGVADCYVSGRKGSLAAVDLKNEKLLWVVDSSISFVKNNFYYPLIAHDFDEDGVLDLINIHGGDSTYSDREKNRSPGELVIVSGKTGQSLMDPIPIPDDRESYSSPILFNLPDVDQSEVVLFGSGGETIQGSLWAVTLASLQECVDRKLSITKAKNYEINLFHNSDECYSPEEIEELRPNHTLGTFVKEKWEDWMLGCPRWSGGSLPVWNPYHVCAYNFVSGGRDGTIIPQVSIDMTGDGRNDLIVTELSDRMILLDGASGEIVWTRTVPDTQTYSVPAPLYFNGDDTPDLLIRVNKGAWMMYDYSYIAVIDGRNGQELWTFNSSQALMASSLTVASSIRGNDGMLFITHGGSHQERRRDTYWSCVRDQADGTGHACVDAAAREQRHSSTSSEDETTSSEEHFPEPDPLDKHAFVKVPDDLWESTPEDSFPDPWNETESFIEDYCGYDLGGLTTYLYFVTPELAHSGLVRPIKTYSPFVYKLEEPQKDSINTRHAESMPLHTDNNFLNTNSLEWRHQFRCACVYAARMQATTPILGDADGDGRLDVSLAVEHAAVHVSVPAISYFFIDNYDPQVMISMDTLEDLVIATYGEGAVDFSQFLPPSQQPWTQYMGRNGDGVYSS